MLSRDYEEFIASLNAHRVRYLILGAHAVAHHARPRATKDLDILVDPTPANAAKALAALRAFFGGADLGFTVADLIAPESIIQIGLAPVRVDLFSSAPGIRDFSSVWRRRVRATFGSVEANYLSLPDLIAAKEAAGRLQDRADLRALRRALAAKRRKNCS